MDREELVKELQAIDQDGGWEAMADEILAREQALRDEVKELKDKYKKLNHELMCELRDPCGTIWEHAKKQQDKMDELKAEHLKVLEAIKDLLGSCMYCHRTESYITAEIGKTNTSQ